MRKKVKFFVSYAHSNKELTSSFLTKFREMIAPSKKHEYVLWQDTGLIVGEKWESQIVEAIDECDFGLLLVSPAFLASKFITEKELPEFLTEKKPSVPVMLHKVDFSKHDLKGLEAHQIFRLDCEGFKEPRAYAECKKLRRDTFVLELFKAIEEKLAPPRH